MPSRSRAGPYRLLSLPAEIRLRIYHYVFNERTIIQCGKGSCSYTRDYFYGKGKLDDWVQVERLDNARTVTMRSIENSYALTLTCKHIREEALPCVPSRFKLSCCHKSENYLLPNHIHAAKWWRNRISKLSVLRFRNSDLTSWSIGFYGNISALPNLQIFELRFTLSLQPNSHTSNEVLACFPEGKPTWQLPAEITEGSFAADVKKTVEDYFAYLLDGEREFKIQAKVQAEGTFDVSRKKGLVVYAVWDYDTEEYLECDITPTPADTTWLAT